MELKKLISYVTAALVLSSGIIAQETTTTAEAPKADGPSGFIIKDAGGSGATLKMSGYVDGYYLVNTNNTDGTGANPGRIFDNQRGAFRLGLIQTRFDMGTDKWQVVADLTHGPNAEAGNFGNIASGGTSLTSTAIKQAYASTVLLDGLTLTVGQFNTHIGYEIIEAYANANYSLSNLFGYGPFYHQGAKFDYAINDMLSVMVGVVNGWDSTNNTDANAEKSGIFQLGIAPSDDFSIYLNYMGGDEGTDSSTVKLRHIGDITAAYSVNDYFSVGLNAAAGQDDTGSGSQTWYGAALYLGFNLNPGSAGTKYSLAYRGEFFDDSDGVRGFGPANTMGHTLTATIDMHGGHFLIKPEVRYDKSDKTIYLDGKKDQTTATIAFIGVY